MRPTPRRNLRKPLVRLASLVALIAALAAAAFVLPLHRIPDAVSHLGAWASIVGIITGALLLCALVPRTAISIASGVLFGPIAGGLIALAAGLVAATATFAIGRVLGRAAVVALEGDRATRLDAWLARRGLLGVAVVRMLPIAPFGLVGYAYGTTSVRWRNYLGGTLIGATPSAFTYAAVGAAVVGPGAVGWLPFLPAAIGLVVTACAFVYWRRSGRQIGAEPERRVPESDADSPAPDNVRGDR